MWCPLFLFSLLSHFTHFVDPWSLQKKIPPFLAAIWPPSVRFEMPSLHWKLAAVVLVVAVTWQPCCGGPLHAQCKVEWYVASLLIECVTDNFVSNLINHREQSVYSCRLQNMANWTSNGFIYGTNWWMFLNTGWRHKRSRGAFSDLHVNWFAAWLQVLCDLMQSSFRLPGLSDKEVDKHGWLLLGRTEVPV